MSEFNALFMKMDEGGWELFSVLYSASSPFLLGSNLVLYIFIKATKCLSFLQSADATTLFLLRSDMCSSLQKFHRFISTQIKLVVPKGGRASFPSQRWALGALRSVAVLGGLLLSCWLWDLLGRARFCRDPEPLPLQAQIWSAEVHPWLDFKLLLLWKVPILSFPRFPLAPIQCCFGMSHLHVIISAALNWGGLWCQGWLSGGTGQFSLLGNCNIFPCCFIMSFIYQIGNSSVEK